MRKVVWVGRTTVFLAGLSVVVGVTLGVASAALAGNLDPLKLGTAKNVATRTTALVGKVASGAAFSVRNPSSGPALDLQVNAGQAPMTVNSQTKVTNLNADQLDGKSDTDFYAAGTKVSDSDKLDGKNDSDFYAAGSKVVDSDKLDGIDSNGFVQGNGESMHDAKSLSPGSGLQDVFGHSGPAPSPDINIYYSCPANLASNGTVKIKNWSGTVNVFSDNGGTNPNDYRQLGQYGDFDQPAAASGEHITFQVQGTGVVTVEVFSVHRQNDCHVQTHGVFSY